MWPLSWAIRSGAMGGICPWLCVVSYLDLLHAVSKVIPGTLPCSQFVINHAIKPLPHGGRSCPGCGWDPLKDLRVRVMVQFKYTSIAGSSSSRQRASPRSDNMYLQTCHRNPQADSESMSKRKVFFFFFLRFFIFGLHQLF